LAFFLVFPLFWLFVAFLDVCVFYCFFASFGFEDSFLLLCFKFIFFAVLVILFFFFFFFFFLYFFVNVLYFIFLFCF